MNEQAKPQCGSCRFFRQEMKARQETETLLDMEAGLCCRYAPRPQLVDDYVEVWKYTSTPQFPIVDDVMWCGEYEPVTE